MKPEQGGRIPAVALELIAGIVVGPAVLGLIEAGPVVSVMASIGVAFLLFLAGLELNLDVLKGAALVRGALSFLLSFALAYAMMVPLGAQGVILSPLLGRVLPMPSVSVEETEPYELGNEPQVAMAITPRSGPVVIEVDYEVDPALARQFYDAMLKLQRARQRNGAFDWSLSRDIADPAVWTERYLCPTWGDYLRLRGPRLLPVDSRCRDDRTKRDNLSPQRGWRQSGQGKPGRAYHGHAYGEAGS